MSVTIRRWDGNPIISPASELPFDFDLTTTFNPGAAWDGERVHLLYTAKGAPDPGTDSRRRMFLGYAHSRDGCRFEFSDRPFIETSPEETRFDYLSVDDPRVTFLEDAWHITYASPAVLPEGSIGGEGENVKWPWMVGLRRSGLAVTRDWVTVEKRGPLTNPLVGDANAVLFPERIDGRYAMLHRPTPFTPWFVTTCYYPATTWIAFSDNLDDWGWDLDWNRIAALPAHRIDGELRYDDHRLFGPEQEWEAGKVGPSGVPIALDEGWLMLYHGVDRKTVYRVGAILLDRNDPRKVIARTPDPIMQPEGPLETSGNYPDCIFPCAHIVIGDDLFIYYGAADLHCCVATVKVKELLDHLLDNCRLK